MNNSIVRHICLISGGKDSTALAIYMRDRNPEIEMEYVFCDTHKELPETYEYLTRIEAYLGIEIKKLSSDLGERGFDHWLKMFRGYLPSPQMRWCTRELKIEPFEQYIGDDPVFLYIGIRADEHREGYISTKPNITPVYPFKDNGITKLDVLRILEDSGIGLPDYYKWRTRSGCYFCFFQRRSEWVGLFENHPDRFELAKGYEKPEEGYTWIQGEGLAELAKPERVQQIKDNELKRKSQAASRRKPKTLIEVFTGEQNEFDEIDGCLICHL
jgi:3'-phosphoadenosine 5'-phosphosulfate sulfotransferase (PAPS reductase)/FAD synthetase